MQEAFTITPEGYDLRSPTELAKKSGLSAKLNDTSLWLGDRREYVDMTELPELSQHFDEEEQLAITDCGSTPRFYRLRFYEPFVAARLILQILPARREIVLDNDHGLLLPLDLFAAICQGRRDWDWSVAERLP